MKKIKSATFLILFSLASAANAQSYSIGHSTVTYSDPARAGRNILTEIYYPASTSGTSVPVAQGSFPLIIFGHGFVMSWDAYQNFWSDLVPRGYIIAFPRTEGNFSPVHAEFGKDLAFLANKIESENSDAASPFYTHVTLRAAILGHSMGGGSAFLASENNNNITTMISFAAANTTPSAITAATHVSVPTLIFSGENDCVAPGVSHQAPMYDSLSSSCKAFISIKGAAHCEFAEYNFNCSFGQSTCSPQPAITGAEQKDLVSDLLNLWLAYYLKDDCAAINDFNDSIAVSPRINATQLCAQNASPVISQNGNVLTSSPAATYQWFKDGNLLQGEVNPTLVPSGQGNYYVSVTYLSSCPFISNVIGITASGLGDISSDIKFSIIPNPARDKILLSFNGNHCKKAMLRFINSSGDEVLSSQWEITGKNEKQIDVGFLAPGLYYLILFCDEYVKSEKLIIE